MKTKMLTDFQIWINAPLIKVYAYAIRKDLVCKKEETKGNNIIMQYKKITLTVLHEKKKWKKLNLNWTKNPDHLGVLDRKRQRP